MKNDFLKMNFLLIDSLIINDYRWEVVLITKHCILILLGFFIYLCKNLAKAVRIMLSRDPSEML